MDPSAIAAAPTGIAGWVAENGNVIFFFAQIAYWFFMVVFFGYAVAQFKRWVNFQLGTGRSGQLRDSADYIEGSDEPDDTVNIDEFVE